MNATAAWRLLPLALVLLGTAPAAAPVAPRRDAPPATVEPTLALRIDLGLEAMERWPGRARGRLRLSLQAIDEVRDLELTITHDDALSLPDAASLPRRGLRLGRGERRDFLLALDARGDRDLPLRVEATFRTADGLELRLGQGLTLETARPAPKGRLHLGAWEVPALVLDGPRP